MADNQTFDPRIHALREDLADVRLKGRVQSRKFVKGEARRIITAVADIKTKPDYQASLMSQLLLGDDVMIFEWGTDFCFAQSCRDDYVGYIATACLGKKRETPTHYICMPRTFLYPEANMKAPILATLSLGSRLTIDDFVKINDVHYGIDYNGHAIIANHLASIGDHAVDYVSVAESLNRTPYLWGGTSAFGIDCSGLVQLAMYIAGQVVLRDSDMQEATIGEILPPDAPLKRGDLVFWRGHVAIMSDSETLIHANGASMDVRYEPYKQVIERIGAQYGRPISHRRPISRENRL